MLYWPKFLITGYAITNTVEAFIPLYLVHQLQLSLLQTSAFVAALYFCKCPFSGFWATYLDHSRSKRRCYPVTLFLLALIASIAFLILFVVLPATRTTATVMSGQLHPCLLLSVSAIIYGIFYQPLGILINSAIIKKLGDFRVLFFGYYVRWGQSVTIVMTGLIGILMKYLSALFAEEEQQQQHKYSVMIYCDDNNQMKAVTQIKYLNKLLLITAMIGLLWICMTVFFIKVEPATAPELDIREEQAPLLLKNALQLTADHVSTSITSTVAQQYPYNSIMAATIGNTSSGGGVGVIFGMGLYKPYSLFAEQLSHISEEDASQLDRVWTNNNTPTVDHSLRPVDSRDSAHSYYSQQSTHTAISGPYIYNTYSRQSAAANSSILDYDSFLGAQYNNENNTNNNNNYMSGTTIAPTNAVVASNALALLPAPTPTIPLVAFYSLFISRKPKATRLIESYGQSEDSYDNMEEQQVEVDGNEADDESNYFYCYNNYYHRNSLQQQLLQQQWQQQQKAKIWRMITLRLTLLCLGTMYSLQNTFLFVYMYSHLQIAISLIACLIMTHLFCGELLVTYIFEKYFIHRLNLICITTSVHFILVFCSIGYMCLTHEVNHTLAICSLFVLQALQAAALQIIWLSGIDHVNLIYYLQSNRMKQRSILSACYSSIGPTIGTLLAGIILHFQQEQRQQQQPFYAASFSLKDYTLIFKSSIALISLSFVISWGWTFNHANDVDDENIGY
ncbi:hypothetical protein BDF20DRAFT_861528 [Mycotypha africana]|uniref:uncharacterized protein n=1 Tax=Mycotypha africana TaxID=64632 RepID=UPI00230036D7|nr:uncharacterized protein BDF20DRAFT_861528 [Mycotypha africana]KAI8984741.1 hypothetical protein BDF20DRAFT_861528 [Mycotypha africana]